MPTKKKAKRKAPKDLCQRRAPDSRLVCEHPRIDHKPPAIHTRIKTQASSGGYAESYVNLAPTHCTVELCTCIAFIEKNGSGEEKLLPITRRR